MRNRVGLVVLALLLAAAGQALAGYVCEYSNSEGSNNDATNRTVGIAVLSEDNFLMTINREFAPDSAYYAICKWTDCTYSTGRGMDIPGWYYLFDVVGLENPFGMAVDGYGNVYLCNNDANHNILVFDGNSADPEGTPYRLETTTDDTIYAIDVDDQGHVFVCYCNADQDRVDIYPSILDDIWTIHSGSPNASIPLPDGLYYGMCVNDAGTEVYVSEYISSQIHRYTGTVGDGYSLDAGFSVQVDSLATAIDIDDQGYLYVISDHWRVQDYDYSKFWVVNLNTGLPTDIIDMYAANDSLPTTATETSAGYFSAVDIEVDEAGNVYVVHDYAWAVEKWVGSPSTGVETASYRGDVPSRSILVQNYPNPFNAGTEIRYRLPAETQVRLEVFNVAGQLVEHLADGRQADGEHLVKWCPADLPSGIYFIHLQAGGQTAVAKAALVR
jgi:hypothetical protein